MSKSPVQIRIELEVGAFVAAMEQATQALRSFKVKVRPCKPLIHNGRKPR
ncbi:hypothetical protein QEH68_06665 [Paenarthrobacter sp. OM7]|nr:hypothetical protein [Paenarthrobacter sp. OM7]WGM21850.1 hypothetical protein QEH68_06665 [Paenarthrobacter sp. OM7]